MTFSEQRSSVYIEESHPAKDLPQIRAVSISFKIYGASRMGVEAGVECGVAHVRGNQLVAEVVVVHAQRSATEKHAGDGYKVTPSI
jgi:hypothetical protein